MTKDEEFEQAISKVLELLGEDPSREGLVKTPSRVVKSWKFLTEGYSQDPKEILNQALFSTSNDEMVLVRDIEFYSTCEHHLLPHHRTRPCSLYPRWQSSRTLQNPSHRQRLCT